MKHAPVDDPIHKWGHLCTSSTNWTRRGIKIKKEDGGRMEIKVKGAGLGGFRETGGGCI